jgi:hypothetical protein
MHTDVIAAENRLTQGERDGDRRLLSDLLAENFSGLDAHGHRMGKNEFISRYCDSGLKFSRLEIEDLSIEQPHAELRLVLGRSHFSVTVSGRHVAGSARFLNCWTRHGQAWQLVASAVVPEQT